MAMALAIIITDLVNASWKNEIAKNFLHQSKIHNFLYFLTFL